MVTNKEKDKRVGQRTEPRQVSQTSPTTNNNPLAEKASQAVKKKKVLIVDDEASICLMLERFFANGRHGLGFSFATEMAENGLDALDKWNRSKDFDLIISDIRMNGGGGINFAENVRKEDKKVPILLISGDYLQDADVVNDVMKRLGNISCLQKPFDLFLALKPKVAELLGSDSSH